MKEELYRNQSASTWENNQKSKKKTFQYPRRVKIKESSILQEDLSQHIRQLMNFSLSDQFNKQLKSEKNQHYEDECFLNPKKPEINQNISRMKDHFIKQYQDQFINEGIQEIHNHKHAVSNILFSGLSASALASAKWHSIQAMRRMREERPQCPEFNEYPLDKEALKLIENTKNKINRNRKINSEHSQLNEKLVLDSSQDLNKYLNNVSQSNDVYKDIYGYKKGEYNVILDYAKKQNMNVNLADNDLQFIKARQTRKRCQTLHNEKKDIKRLQRKKYYDYDDGIYGVRPNKIQSTRIQLNQRNNIII